MDHDAEFNCPIDFALHILGSKWSIAILRDLCQGTKRTSELMRSLVGISPRTLSERLRELEGWGLINRSIYAEIPPRVEYGLTDSGKDIEILLAALDRLGVRWQQAKGLVPADGTCLHCSRTEAGQSCPVIPANGEKSVVPAESAALED